MINSIKLYGKEAGRSPIHPGHILALWLLLYTVPVQAQYDLNENKIWVYGDCSGLDFNSGTPVPIQTAVWGFGEANASVCDTSGQLLFYTNGTSVWNRSHNRMSTGYNLTGITSPSPVLSPPPPTETTTQGALITAVPGVPGQYYIFSLSGFEWGLRGGRLYYSIVDMQLNNGLGDIIQDKKGILIDTRLTEQMTAVPGNNCNMWLLVHSLDSAQFKAYEISASGISPTPVVSHVGTSWQLFRGTSDRNAFWAIGALAASPDRRKLAAGYYYSGRVELYDFDPATGNVSNTLLLDSIYSSDERGYYGVCFSPDNSKLYAGDIKHGALNQFDISLATPAAVISSKTAVGPYYTISKLRLAPDHKIYLQEYPGTMGPLMFQMAGIAAPDAAGTACLYTPGIVQLLFGSPWIANVRHASPPDAFVKPLPPDTMQRRVTDTLVCDHLESLALYASPGFSGYEWDNGETGEIRTVYERDRYWVTYREGCHIRVDTFLIGGADVGFSLGRDTVICGDPIPVRLEVPVEGATYIWQDGSRDRDFTAVTSGDYYVTAYKEGCTAGDTVSIRFVSATPDLGEDKILCRGTPVALILDATPPEGAQVMWNTGSQETSIQVADTGSYYVTVSYPPCTGSDTITIRTEMCDCFLEIPSAFTPNGDGKNDLFRPVVERGCPVHSFELSVYNRWGARIWQSRDISQGWDGFEHNMPAATGTYMYLLRFSGGTHRKEQIKKGDVTLIR